MYFLVFGGGFPLGGDVVGRNQLVVSKELQTIHEADLGKGEHLKKSAVGRINKQLNGLGSLWCSEFLQ